MRKFIIGLIAVGVVFIGGIGTYLFLEFQKGTEDLQKQKEEVEEEVKKPVELSKDKTGSNPFGDDVTQEEMTDEHFQEYIHGMSHQKVRAEKKWSFYELTQERVKWLHEALEVANVEHKDVYQTILDKWVKGDFSTAYKDHNAVWELQGGTVGKATGLLSAEEEQAYLESAK
mgnify:CR=1 FL=1